MAIDYKGWCDINSDIKPLIRALKSSIPEQYIGFYLQKAFGENEVEYQTQFDWLGKSSLDIYIPSLQLAIEYNGVFYHSKKATIDKAKVALCKSRGIYVISIIEQTINQVKSKKHNEINYYYEKKYKNINVAIDVLFKKINKKYGVSLKPDVDIKRDEKAIVAYVQNKYHQKSIAHVWPESKDYWLDENNALTVFDVLYTSNGCYMLKCPNCGKSFKFFMRYFHHRHSLIPCECECKEIEEAFEEAIKRYKETGEVTPFENSLHSRRLYDRMASVVEKMQHCRSIEEAEMYKKLGFYSISMEGYFSWYNNSKKQ